MRLTSSATLASLLIVTTVITDACAAEPVTDQITELKQQAKTKTKAFAAQLKQTLVSAIKAGGLEQGVVVCSTVAEDIAKQHSVDGWTVKRVSVKNRNMNNSPNLWQLEVLKNFETQSAQGVDISKLAYADLVSHKDKFEFRFAKAIPTAKACLNCHGQHIPSNAKEILNHKYPDDKAIGYEVGQLRGAFVLTKQW